jgi:hypothetical protein
VPLLAIVGLLLTAPAAYGRTHHHRHHRKIALDPVIFVHGYEGSGSQFESQQLRLTSNGYPGKYIAVFEYDSTQFAGAIAGAGISSQQEAPLFVQLDGLIAHMKAITHRPKGPISPPGRKIKGARNVSIPDSTHVQCATSPRSFALFYKFFTGKTPQTTQIVRQKGSITLSGRDVNFPQNTGLSGATVQVWPIDQTTGQRTSTTPLASFPTDDTGNWGPVRVKSGKRYEFAEVRSGFPTHHFYYEPFIRSDQLIRLLESDALRTAGGVPDPRSVAMVIIRYKELWGDQGSQSDVLTINGLSVCNAITCPLSKEVNGLVAADFNHDGMSEPTQTWMPYQSLGYFVSSVDVFAPAQTPPNGEVTIGLKSRGHGPVSTITFPNYSATTDDVTVQLNDFEHTSPPKAG